MENGFLEDFLQNQLPKSVLCLEPGRKHSTVGFYPEGFVSSEGQLKTPEGFFLTFSNSLETYKGVGSFRELWSTGVHGDLSFGFLNGWIKLKILFGAKDWRLVVKRVLHGFFKVLLMN